MSGKTSPTVCRASCSGGPSRSGCFGADSARSVLSDAGTRTSQKNDDASPASERALALTLSSAPARHRHSTDCAATEEMAANS